MKLVVRRGAAADLDAAYEWYQAERDGLGNEYLDEVNATFVRIVAGPLRFPLALQDAWRALVHRFPYSVYFRVTENKIRILAVVHQSRHPSSWKMRVR